jgi:hypothetical protein
MDGWSTNPNITSNDMPRSRSLGEWAGYNMVRGRDIEIDFNIGYANAGQTTAALLQTLTAALNPVMQGWLAPNTEQPLWIQLPGQPLLCAMVRVQKSALPYTFDYANSGVMKGSVWFHATDPRLYAAPVQFTGTVASGAAVNFGPYNGNIDVLPRVTFANATGTTTGITLTATVALNSSYAGGLAATAWVINPEPGSAPNGTTYTVDTDLHLITKSGNPYFSASAASPTWPSLFSLVPGICNSQGTSYNYGKVVPTFTGGGTLTVTLQYAPAYLL